MAQRFDFSKDALQQIVFTRARAKLVALAKEALEPRVEKAKEAAIFALLSHPLTADIENLKQNRSQIIDGEGDIRQLLGFPPNFQPTVKIEELIKKGIQIKEKQQFGDEIQLNVIFPQFETIEKETKDDMPWAQNMSWVSIVDNLGETELPNVAFYLNLEYPIPQSRSGGGIQQTTAISKTAIKRVKYYEDIINAFKQELLKK